MANVHAAIKQIRKDARRKIRNQAVLSELHTLWKKFIQLVTSNPGEARTFAQTLTSKWDRAASGGIVPKARANRKKARIASALTASQAKSR